MEGFTLIDGAVGIIIVLSALLAFSRGFVREVMAIGGWVAAAVLAFVFADQARPLVRQIPYVGDFLGENCELLIIASFVAVFALALVVASLFTPLLSSLIQRSILGPIDQVLGFFFGVLRGVVLVAVGFFLYDTILPNSDIQMVEASRSAAIFSQYSDDIEAQNPEEALGWIQKQYVQLIGSCG